MKQTEKLEKKGRTQGTARFHKQLRGVQKHSLIINQYGEWEVKVVKRKGNNDARIKKI